MEKINLLSILLFPTSTDHVQGIYFLLVRNVTQPLTPNDHMTLGMTGRCLASLKHVTDHSKFKINFEYSK